MKLSDLDFLYPEELIAISPQRPSRMVWIEDGKPQEISKKELFQKMEPGDVFVVNETKVSKRRVFGRTLKEEFEILFLERISNLEWKVLFPASRLKSLEKVSLPDNVILELQEQGLPQIVRISKKIDEDYFLKFGEVPLPPYIQKARGQRHQQKEDESWYQTSWAKEMGSQAAPTASLHFTQEDLMQLSQKGVFVEKITLHVGMGTFLPIKTEDLNQHEMHFEEVLVGHKVWNRILEQKKKGHKIWGLGTTVVRSLESCAYQKIGKNSEGDFVGKTDLFIREDFDFKIIDILLTNFHQPKTTLLALVASFAGLENVKRCYNWAIERKFRLFSYGDLTIWKKKR